MILGTDGGSGKAAGGIEPMAKGHAVTAAVADRLLAVRVGAQLPTTARLAEQLDVGYGTIHTALQILQSDGLVTLSTHGHQGTRLVDRDLVGLWRASTRGSLVGVLPLPQSAEFAGLATAAATLAGKAGLPLQLTFRQGSRERFALLREGRVDWVLCSASAADREASWSDQVLLLPGYTYYSRDSVVVITAAGQRPGPHPRVAIDRRSYDHTALTLAEFPDADYVDATYWWIPDMIVHDEVDAAIWHATSSSTLNTATGLAVHPLHGPGPGDEDDFTRAALVCRRDDPASHAVLRALFEPGDLADIQHRVMTRRLQPAF